MMNSPVALGIIVVNMLQEMGISVTEAAKALGVSRQQLHNVISGRSVIVAEMAYRLECALGSTADAWLRMQSNYDLAQIRNRPISIKVTRLAVA